MRRLLLFLITAGCSAESAYISFPVEIYESAILPIEKIIPDLDYDYWEYRLSSVAKEEILYRTGKQQVDSLIKGNDTGFFIECLPLICYSYIVAEKDQRILIIDSADEFKKFIGTVDNLEEVVILIKLKGYWFDPGDRRTGTYKKTKDGYDLFVLDYESCPVTYKSVRALLKFNGDFEVIEVETIKEETDCIIS